MFGWSTLIAVILTAALNFYPQHEFIWERPAVRAGAAGTIIGRRIAVKLGSEDVPQETFFGVPYAVPPVGDLRFHPPVPLPPGPDQTIDAFSYGRACMQAVDRPPPYWPIGRSEVSEDCLHLNIIRPVLNTTSPLPVMVWIYGGGLEEGYTKWYDGRHIVAQSVAINQPIILVSMDYRLHAFGFLVSQDILERSRARKDVGLNLGYLDQRLALEWVQKYISRFGGDPKKVTVFGESGGAFSIGAHLAAEGNKPRELFRAAIMQSGSISGGHATLPSTYQVSYERFISELSCGADDEYAKQFRGDAIACLRSLPATKITDLVRRKTDATGTIAAAVPALLLPWWPVQDGDFYSKYPSELVRTGRFGKIPTLIGTDLDEGTALSVPHLSDEEALRKHILEMILLHPDTDPRVTSNAIDKLLELYPDVPRDGCPLVNPSDGTAASSSFDPDSRLFEPLESNQFKRWAIIHGDHLFESPRRLFLDAHNGVIAGGGPSFGARMRAALERKVPVWSFQYRQPLKGIPGHLGVYHGSEIPAIFARHADEESEEGEVARAISRTFIRFASTLDPNGPEIPTWPPYDTATRSMLQIRAGNFTIIPDDWRVEALKYQLSPEWARLTGR